MNRDLVDICCENLCFGIYRRYCCKVFKGTKDDHKYTMNEDYASFLFGMRMFGLIHNSNDNKIHFANVLCIN